MNKKLTSLVLMALFPAVAMPKYALAQEMPRDWRSLRAAGMGDSFTASSNDEDAPFGNPAGLARSRNPRARAYVHKVIFPGASIGGNTIAVSGIEKARQAPKTALSKIAGQASSNPGKLTYTEVQLYPAIVFGAKSSPTFLIGFPSRIENRITASDADTTLARVDATATLGGVLGLASSTRGGTFSYGLSVRPNVRYSYVNDEHDISSMSPKGLKSTVMGEGKKTTAVAVDGGILFTAADFWLPTLGLSVRNIPIGCVDDYTVDVTGDTLTMCGTVRNGSTDTAINSTRVDPTEVRAGFAITPRAKIEGARVNMRLSVDVYPLPIKSGSKSYGLTNLNVNKLVHAGAELYFGHALQQQGFAIRGGVSQTQTTYGLSLIFLGISIEYASYSEDVGIGLSPTRDRRHLIGLSTDW